jgi:phosphoribosylaminoimidazole-succinocarboxamide synthase
MSDFALYRTDFHFPGQTHFYSGKVRDVYTIRDRYIVMVASDRISAFDVILPRPIPFKGQVLNQIAAQFLNLTRSIVPNWVVDVPDANVTIGKKCKPIKLEMVIRGYLAGHALREYRKGKRSLCGASMPNGLKENDAFPEPIITPTTKATRGHDVDITKGEILRQGIVTAEIYQKLEEYTRKLFAYGTRFAAERGLILVDTKYEFGESDGKILLIDEVHTPDSSRYFYMDGYEERQKKNEPQKQLSKEFVREWLIANNFMGKEGQKIPVMTDEWVDTISKRYIELFERVTGKKFDPPASGSDVQKRIETAVLSSLQNLI